MNACVLSNRLLLCAVSRWVQTVLDRINKKDRCGGRNHIVEEGTVAALLAEFTPSGSASVI